MKRAGGAMPSTNSSSQPSSPQLTNTKAFVQLQSVNRTAANVGSRLLTTTNYNAYLSESSVSTSLPSISGTSSSTPLSAPAPVLLACSAISTPSFPYARKLCEDRRGFFDHFAPKKLVTGVRKCAKVLSSKSMAMLYRKEDAPLTPHFVIRRPLATF